MIGIDTNVLLRALTNDDPVRSPAAAHLLARLTPEAPGHINHVVLAELAWNLRRKYKASRGDVLNAVEALLQSSSYLVERRQAVIEGLETARAEGLDFADALIGTLNKQADCETTATFDAKASRSRLFAPVT